MTDCTEVAVPRVMAALRQGREIALVDVRHERAFATGHPLFASSLPLGLIEMQAWDRFPRRDVRMVVYDAGEGYARLAARRLAELGYSQVSLLSGKLDGWVAAGGELFADVNSPSKAFGELVAHKRATPMISAADLRALMDERANVRIVDVRPSLEYNTMNIPGAINVPGCEIVDRVRTVAPDPSTLVVVNCAGRTRGIIATQSLLDLRLPNDVVALRNGTIGWALAGMSLDRQRVQNPRAGADGERRLDTAMSSRVRSLAVGAGVRALDTSTETEAPFARRTVYRFDVRSSEEYVRGHLPGYRHAPGGQLIQETDYFAPVRGAVLLLSSGDETGRAELTGYWLAQMGWDVSVIRGSFEREDLESGPWVPSMPRVPDMRTVDTVELEALMAQDVPLLDLASSVEHTNEHVPGSRFVLRTELAARVSQTLDVSSLRGTVVLTSPDGIVAAFAAADLEQEAHVEVLVLSNGTEGWRRSGRPVETGFRLPLSEPSDVYRRPYIGTDVDPATMHAYLDWELGLVAQLERDATHRFFVLESGEAT